MKHEPLSDIQPFTELNKACNRTTVSYRWRYLLTLLCYHLNMLVIGHFKKRVIRHTLKYSRRWLIRIFSGLLHVC